MADLVYAYYPGCSLESSAKEYDSSVRAVFAHLGVELRDIPDWSCCGAVHGDLYDMDAALALPARNLAIVESLGLDKVIAPCSGCYKNLRRSSKAASGDKVLRAKINAKLPESQQLSKAIEVLHPLYVLLNEVGMERIKDAVVKPLTKMKVGSYYGCMLTRPKDVFDSTEKPRGLDDLMDILGAQVIDYPMKAKCCGGALAISHSEVTAKLTGNVLGSAKQAGADMVTLACPMCHTALDGYQAKAQRVTKQQFDMPVLYFTQLMGLAFDLPYDVLGLNRHIVSTQPVMARMG